MKAMRAIGGGSSIRKVRTAPGCRRRGARLDCEGVVPLMVPRCRVPALAQSICPRYGEIEHGLALDRCQRCDAGAHLEGGKHCGDRLRPGPVSPIDRTRLSPTHRPWSPFT